MRFPAMRRGRWNGLVEWIPRNSSALLDLGAIYGKLHDYAAAVNVVSEKAVRVAP